MLIQCVLSFFENIIRVFFSFFFDYFYNKNNIIYNIKIYKYNSKNFYILNYLIFTFLIFSYLNIIYQSLKYNFKFLNLKHIIPLFFIKIIYFNTFNHYEYIQTKSCLNFLISMLTFKFIIYLDTIVFFCFILRNNYKII